MNLSFYKENFKNIPVSQKEVKTFMDSMDELCPEWKSVSVKDKVGIAVCVIKISALCEIADQYENTTSENYH